MTVVLTVVAAAIVLASGILALSQGIGALDAAPGFVQFVVLAILIIGMVRRAKIAFLGAPGICGLFVLLGIGALFIRPAAFQLSWFPATLAVTIVLYVAIVVVAWRSIREM